MSNIVKMKECPEGKVLNPKTNRCIKIRPEKPVRPAKPDKPAKTAKPNKMAFGLNQGIIDNLKILREYEEIMKEPYKAKAYDKVIDAIELYDKQIKTPEDVKEIAGVGKKIEDKILQYLDTGKMEAVERAREHPKYIFGKQLMNIYGIGPAKIDELMRVVSSIDELKSRPELLNEKQKIGLKYYEDLQLRIPIAEGKKHHKVIEKAMGKDIEFEMVGSYRRKNKDLGDIDILIKNPNADFNLKSLTDKLQESGYIVESLASGKNKFMGICRLAPDLPARRIDMLVADESYYYFALLYFTGSYTFNIYMRRVALEKGLSLSEYGFKDNVSKQMIDTSSVISSEEDIFKYLGIAYVAPNKR